jgi:CBS domain-containing protein
MSVSVLLGRKPASVVTVAPEATVSEAARLIMEHRIGGLPVVEGGRKVVGFVAERDIVGAVHRHSKSVGPLPVKAIMSRPAPLCSGEDRVRDVMARMTRDRLRHLVVMDGDRVVGVISVGDLVKHRLEELETETGVLRDYVAAQRARG